MLLVLKLLATSELGDKTDPFLWGGGGGALIDLQSTKKENDKTFFKVLIRRIVNTIVISLSLNQLFSFKQNKERILYYSQGKAGFNSLR